MSLTHCIISDTLPPSNDTETDPPSDVIVRGHAQHIFSHALSELVHAIVQVPLLEGNRAEIAAAYMKVEELGMAACRALDEAV